LAVGACGDDGGGGSGDDTSTGSGTADTGSTPGTSADETTEDGNGTTTDDGATASGDSTSAGGSTTGPDDTGTTGDTGTSGDTGTTGDTDPTGDGDATGSTGDADPTGGAADLPEACADACANVVDCVPDDFPGGTAECEADCVAMGEKAEPVCVDLLMDFAACISTASCDEIENGPACPDEEAAFEDACGDCGIGGGGNDTMCEVESDCDGVVQTMTCDTVTCVCIEDGAQVGSCPANNVCAEGDVFAYANTCCGWDFL
jgi:hypothetical protein